MLEFLSNNLRYSINSLNLNLVYELRIRVGQPVRINYNGKYEYLGKQGIVFTKENALIASKREVEDMIYSAGEFSVYAVEEQIKRGFITAKDGVRIGLAGEYVFTKGQPVTMRNISSLCIRIPHKIVDSSSEIYEKCFKNNLGNLLIVSLPGLGKTTILKDLISKISYATLKNILICDERGELCDFEIGPTCDRIVYADKNTAFDVGIRAMRPDLIVTDEIASEDLNAIQRIIHSGVNVIATAHLDSYENVVLHKMNLFDHYAVLDKDCIGKLRYVYNNKGELLYQNAN